MSYFTFILNVVSAFLATLGFAGIFNIKGKKMFYASLGGSVCWFTYLYCKNKGLSIVDSSFISSLITAIYCEVMARTLKTPVTGLIICGTIPLVPGGGMYYTMKKCIEGDIMGALSTGLTTLSMACSIALAIIIVSSILRLHKRFKETIINKKA